MGGRQSSPGGSTGGFVPSSNNSPQDNSSDNQSSASSSPLYHNGSNRARQQLASASGSDWRQRARSLTSVINSSSSHNSSNGQPIVTVSPLGHASFNLSASPDSLNSIDDLTPFGRVFSAHSLPVHLAFNLKCPMCSKTILPDDVECHLVMCLTKPRINYNEDILTEDKGECVICLDDLSKGNTIARLPCLCVYHKTCIDKWFSINRSCPEHPLD